MAVQPPSQGLIAGIVDVTEHTLFFLTGSEIARTATRVCKSWNHIQKAPGLWQEVSKNDQMIVEGENRDFRGDYIRLYPIMISSAKIGEYLGKVVGEVP